MPLQHALRFLSDLDQLPQLRGDIYTCLTEEQVHQTLSQHGFHFTWDDFENAVNMLHVRCQTEMQADDLMQKAVWFRSILASLTNS